MTLICASQIIQYFILQYFHKFVIIIMSLLCVSSVCMFLLGRCVSSLKNLFFMLENWWLEWCKGGCGGGGCLSLSSSSAALRNRTPATLTNRIAALRKIKGEQTKKTVKSYISKSISETLNTTGEHCTLEPTT